MFGLVKKIICFILFVIVLADNNNPEPPAIPNIQAVYDHEKITIYWDRVAEKSIDPLSGYSDFEGYRIYRSTDGGETWGSYWDKIYNYSDDHVGWEPLEQYDIRSLRDSSHCIYSNAYYESNPDGEKCYSNSIYMGQIDLDSLIIILDKQYLKIDTIFQEIDTNWTNLLSAYFIDDIEKFNQSLAVNSIIVDTLYDSSYSVNLSLDSLSKLLDFSDLLFEPVFSDSDLSRINSHAD
jgi:hypothetical protein